MISVNILTYNRFEKLIRCLDKIYSSEFKDFEVIVVDNGSSDGTADKLKSLNYKNLRVINNNDNANYCQARDLSVLHSEGDKIAFIDDDCVPDDHWLEKINLKLDEYDAVGGIVLPYKRYNYPAWWCWQMGWLVGFSTDINGEDKSGRKYYPQTANLAVRKHIFETFKFQTEEKQSNNNFYGREDASLWRKLRINGYKLCVDNNLIVYHDIPDDRFKFSFLQKRSFNDGLIYFIREKNYDYIKCAISDIIDFPTRCIKSIFNEEYGNVVYQYFWTVRQCGFLKAYIDFQTSSKAPIILKEFIKHLFNKIKGVSKALLRKTLVFLYKLRAGLESAPTNIKNILFVSVGFIGDMVIIMPALKLIKKTFPQAHLSLLCYKNGHELLSPENIVDEIIVLDKNNVPSTEEKIKERDYDVALIHYFHNTSPNFLFKMRLKSKIKKIIGFDSDVGFDKQLWYDLLDEKVEKKFDINEIENSMNLLKEIGIEEKPEKYSISFSDAEKEHRENLLKKYNLKNKEIIALHIGTINEYKKWAEENWAELINKIESLNKYETIIISGPDDYELANRIIKKGKSKTLNLCRETSTRQLALLLTYCKLLITTCSGPKHIAYLVDTPTITLYGISDYLRWHAYWNDGRHRAVKSNNVDLTYEEKIGLPENHLMRIITPQMVFDEVIDLLDKESDYK